MIFQAPPRSLAHFSSSALCNRNSKSFIGYIPNCCCSWWPSHDTGFSKMVGSLVQLGSTFTNSFSWAPFRDSRFATQCQAPAALHDPFKPLKQVEPRGHLTTKFICQTKVKP